jgi:hypothetical protein
MTRIKCPSEYLEDHIQGQEQANFPTDKEIMDKLDAYGKLTYSVGFSDEWTEDSLCECKEPKFKYPSTPHNYTPTEPTPTALCEHCGNREYRGDWLVCFDFCVYSCPDGVKIAYHEVFNSNSGGSIEETERGFVEASKAPFDLPDHNTSLGMDDGVTWFPDEIKKANDCNDRWNKDIKQAIEEASNWIEEVPSLDPCRLN